MKELLSRPLADHVRSLRRGDYSAEELCRAYLKQIEERDGEIGAYLTVSAKSAVERARALDSRRRRGEATGILHGLPVAVKDNICTRGVRTTCASRMLEDYIPPYDATVIERLQSEGAILLGKTNMDEFGMGSGCEFSSFSVTRNPHGSDRVAGGSSGGSAAAVAADEAAFALGSDTGGSVRLPAAFCGVVGMKPTYGSVSRYGLVAFASSLEQIGPLTRTVRDNALVLGAVMGHDGRDATCYRQPVDLTGSLERGLAGLRIGVPSGIEKDVSTEIQGVLERAREALSHLGCEIVSLPEAPLRKILPAYYLLSCAEASSNLARYDGVRYGHRTETAVQSAEELCRQSRTEGFGDEVKRRILLGTYALSRDRYDDTYGRARRVALSCRDFFADCLGACDAILMPTYPRTAYPLGSRGDDPTEPYYEDRFTVPANLTGLPALSLPYGFSAEGLPLSVQLMGREESEGLLYRIGARLEETV